MLGLETATIREILEILRRTYCGNVGVQYMHISDPEEKAWLQERIEGRDKEIAFTQEGKIAILKKLIETEGFEHFLHASFPGTKRFGLDGGEALVPALEQIIKRGGALGVEDIVIGMPHRGRLNVLAARDGQALPGDLPRVPGRLVAALGRRGLGRREVPPGRLVGPRVRRQQRPPVADRQPLAPGDRQPGGARQGARQAGLHARDDDAGRGHVLPLLLHGDAAFAGQGVVAECFALSGLKGYRTGGTIHFIVNNQIGFTTSPRTRAPRPIRPTWR